MASSRVVPCRMPEDVWWMLQKMTDEARRETGFPVTVSAMLVKCVREQYKATHRDEQATIFGTFEPVEGKNSTKTIKKKEKQG